MDKALFYSSVGFTGLVIGQVLVPYLVRSVSPYYQLLGDNYGVGFMDVVHIVVLVCIQLVLRYYLWDPIVRSVALRFGMTKRAKQDKYVSTLWIVLCYVVLFQFGVSVAYGESWWPFNPWNFPEMVRGYPNHPLSGAFKHYYLLQMSYYIVLTIMLLKDTRKKDHVMMITHHLVSFVLILGSYLIGGHRWGAATLLFYDIGDIFLYMAMCFNYNKLKLPSEITFCLFVPVWFVTRHLYFPCMLILNYAVASADNLEFFKMPAATFRYLLYALSWLIEAFSVIWFIEILRVVRAFARGEKAKDARSDTDTDSEEGSTKMPNGTATSIRRRPVIATKRTRKSNEW